MAAGSAGVFGVSLAALLLLTRTAAAFPFLDPSNQDTAPTGMPTGAPSGTDLPATDAKGLRNQLRLINPGAAGNPSGWTIVPRVTVQQMFTDNAYEVRAPRRADAITVIAPGINIQSDTNRLQMNFDYQPNLIMHAVNGPLNVLTQQLTGTGLLTVVPDLAYVDFRAYSGVQSRLGALAGTGTGGVGTAGVGAGNNLGTYNGTGTGLNRNNEVQTSSFGISPYLLRQFGDYGTGKVGVSVNASRYADISGFAASPLPTGGSNGQSLLTTEEIAHYQSGEIWERLRYSFDLDLSQSKTLSNNGRTTAGNTVFIANGNDYYGQRETVTNQISYALNRTFTFLASAGYENIRYGGGVQRIDGLTWSIGATVTPGPYSALTVTYGHQNGADSFSASGHFDIGGRSFVSLSYSNTVGTQLENLQNQLNNSQVGQFGQFISSVTGGPTLIATNGLGLQNGVFRYKSAVASWTTQWPRDMIQATISWTEQTSLTPTLVLASTPFTVVNGQLVINTTTGTSAGPTTDALAATLQWTHEVSADMVLNAGASYSLIRRGGIGNDGALSTNVGLQYLASESTTMSASYSFFDRVSRIPGYSLYENILLLGITKRF